MQAQTGDKLLIHGKTVGASGQHGEVIEARGDGGGPPYLVRFDDGHERLIFPGPDCEVEPA